MPAPEPDTDPTLLTPRTPVASGAEAFTRVQANAPVHFMHPDGVPTVAGYEVGREIARGGMGVVYAARDLALDRPVAIKVMLPGMSAAEFERESKVTARLPHPGVPPVYALGQLLDGRPFLAMKLIKGETLKKILADRPDPTADRGQLVAAFGPVCQAVGYAHAQGIVHRDLKPANVMVGAFGEVQVMDWGLAKVVGGAEPEGRPDDLTTDSKNVAASVPGQVKGTPAYMAPEQARGEPVDARADVFALGGILLAILTGRPPFVGTSVSELIRRAGAGELAEAHARLDACGADAELVALCRRCLSPRPADRPANAQAVADGLTGYLTGVQERLQRAERERAVTAARAVEERRRRKVQMIAVSLVLLALLGGVVGTTLGLLEARHQADRAREEAAAKETARADEARQRVIAEANEREANAQKTNALAAAEGERQAKEVADQKRQEAERNLAFARTGNEILGSVFAGLDPKKNYASLGEFSKALTDNLKKAVKALDGSAIGAPLEVAAMQNTLGMSLLGLGEYGLAVEVLEKARDTRKSRLGPDHHSTLQSTNNLATSYKYVRKLDKALPLFEETLVLTKAKLGPDHSNTLASMNNLAEGYQAAGKLDKALPLFEETLVLTKAKLGPDHPSTLASMNNLGEGYQAAGKLDKALPLFEEALPRMKAKLGPDHPSTLRSMNNLALGYKYAGKLDKALPLFEETLPRMKVKLGPDHPDTLATMNNLATCYDAAGKRDKALPLYEEALRLRTVRLGPDHPDTLGSMNNLALGYQATGKLDKALSLFEESLALLKARLGPNHPDSLQSMNNLAACYRAAGKLDKALPLFEEALPRMKAKLGPDHSSTLATMNNLAACYRAAGKLDKALPLFEEALARMKANLGPDHPDTLTTMNNLAACYDAAGKRDKALPLFEEALARMKANLGPDHPSTLGSMNSLAVSYWSLKRLDKSVPMFEELLPLRATKLGRDHPDTLVTMANLGVNYKDAGRLKEAIPLLEEAYRASKKQPALSGIDAPLLDAYVKAGRTADAGQLIDDVLADTRKRLPKDSPQLAGQLAQFGLSLLEAKGFADAEPLLRESLAIRAKTQPDIWFTFNTQSMLGGALLGQKKYADAEPLLLKGYEGMKAREKTIPPQGSIRLPEALDRLIDLYTATDKPDEAKKWRAERAKYPNVVQPPREKK